MRRGAPLAISGAERTRLVPVRRTRQRWTVASVIFQIVPDYNIEAASEGLTEDQVQAELYINWHASANKRVFPEFSDQHIAVDPLPFDPNRELVLGWDFGNTPACVPTQISATGQWFVYPSVMGARDEAIGIYEFGELVADYLQTYFADPSQLTIDRLRIRHYGDPAGCARPQRNRATTDEKTELRSAYEILEYGTRIVVGERRGKPIYQDRPGWGWVIRKGDVATTVRLQAIRDRLNSMINGQPALLVCPTADDVISAFKGGYHYGVRQDGTYEHNPKKNYSSHVMDALQYPCTQLFGMKRAPGGGRALGGALNERSLELDDEDLEYSSRSHRFASQASTRRR